jgi:hypothetical protein
MTVTNLQAKQDLFDAMQRLRLAAGAPSYREITDGVGNQFSITTSHNAINGPDTPRWPTLRPVVEYLTNDPAQIDAIHKLWEKTQEPMVGPRLHLVAAADGQLHSTTFDEGVASEHARTIHGLVFRLPKPVADYRE